MVWGDLSLVTKGKTVVEEESEFDHSECDITNEEFSLMVSNPKRFSRKKFPSNKNQNRQGNYNSKRVKEEKKKRLSKRG